MKYNVQIKDIDYAKSFLTGLLLKYSTDNLMSFSNDKHLDEICNVNTALFCCELIKLELVQNNGN